MTMDRRRFLSVAGAGAAAATTALSRLGAPASAGAASTSVSTDAASFRALYPRAQRQVYLDCAAHCPLGTHVRAGMEKYMDFHMYGPDDGRAEYVEQAIGSVKDQFARLVGVKPSEVAFVPNTKAGEWIVFGGLDVQRGGGNVVTNDLHYAGSVHSYIGHQKAGLDLRLVKARDWVVDLEDMEAAIDDKTRLVAFTLLSNVNGHIEDARAIVEIAHAKGAYVYADVIQAVGAIPVDLKALGLDFAACSNYKWLCGSRGSAFLYVREDLQGTVVKDALYPGYVRFNYPPWVDAPEPGSDPFPYSAPVDASRYEPGNISREGYCGQYEALSMLEQVGVDRMLAHNMTLVDRLRKELPASKYRCITPEGTRGPVIVFIPSDYEGTRSRIERAGIQITLTGNRMRISPNYYNDQEDVDRLLEALV